MRVIVRLRPGKVLVVPYLLLLANQTGIENS